MKILFVSMVGFENNTSATIQNKGIVIGISKLGHEVDILTLKPNYTSFSYDESMNDISKIIKNSYYIDIDSRYKALMEKKPKLKRIENFDNKINFSLSNKSILRSGRNIIKNIYNNISIFDAQKVNVKGVSKIEIEFQKYDFIISASDPKSSHLIVDRILKKNNLINAKWIQYWGDPMLNDITRKKSWRDPLVKHFEKKLISSADKVIYASPLTLEIQKETFPRLSFKMDYANQVYTNSLNDYNNESGNKSNSEITVGYFGAYQSEVRNILPFYNAAKNGSYKVDICGHSDVELENTKNISIHGVVTYKIAVEMEKESDILICICNNKGTQIPGKIYYSASYNKPIIVVLDGEYKTELKKYFLKFNRYILCDNEIESINNAVEQAKEQLNTAEFRVSEQLTPEYMARKMLES